MVGCCTVIPQADLGPCWKREGSGSTLTVRGAPRCFSSSLWHHRNERCRSLNGGAHRVPFIRAFYDLRRDAARSQLHSAVVAQIPPHVEQTKSASGGNTLGEGYLDFRTDRAFGANGMHSSPATWENEICPRPSEVQHFQRLPFRRGKSSSLLTPAALPDTISLNGIVTVNDTSPAVHDLLRTTCHLRPHGQHKAPLTIAS
jgi:hypothetical protein